jgi:hypothetical protein
MMRAADKVAKRLRTCTNRAGISNNPYSGRDRDTVHRAALRTKQGGDRLRR